MSPITHATIVFFLLSRPIGEGHPRSSEEEFADVIVHTLLSVNRVFLFEYDILCQFMREDEA